MELAENPRNWRRHPATQLAALTDVLGEVGWAGACLYNERTGRLIDGHARKQIALAQGADQVPVLVGNWSEEQERLILATLDPLAAQAEIEADRLSALLETVRPASDVLKQLLGELQAQQTRALIDQLAAPAPVNGTAAEMPAEPDEPATEYRTVPFVVTLAQEQTLRQALTRARTHYQVATQGEALYQLAKEWLDAHGP